MRFGAVIDCNTEKVKIVKKVGYDYAELNISKLASMSDAEFEAFAAELQDIKLPCEVGYCFLPDYMSISNPKADRSDVKMYISGAIKRASRLGVKIIVLDSGKARNIPDDVDIYDGFNALLRFVADFILPEAERYAIRVAIEPLPAGECNVIHTVREAAAFAKLTQRENIGAVVCNFNMAAENDDITCLSDYAGSIIHAYVSRPCGGVRYYPNHDDSYDQTPFLKELYKTGCMRVTVRADKYDGCTFENATAEGLYTLIDAYDGIAK